MSSSGGTYGICYEFKKSGTCGYGSKCKFRHVSGGSSGGGGGRGGRGGNSSTIANQKQGICHQFQRDGFCRFGNSCRFAHPPTGTTGGGGGSRPSGQAPNDIKRFLKHLSQTGVSRFGKELEESSSLWHRCWHHHTNLDSEGTRMLIESLAKAPGSLGVSPPPVDLVEKVLARYLKASGFQSSETVLTKAKTALAAVTRLLQFEWEPPTKPIQDAICNMACAAEATLQKQVKEHRQVSSDLMKLVEQVEKPWTIKMREMALICHEVDSAGSVPESFADWKTANIKWLSNPHYFAPSSCPKMKVGAEGVYENSDKYMETVHKLWIAMTFADGHAAFAPHCRTRGNNGNGCNSSLWPIAETANTSGMRCRTRSCQRPVEYACRIRNHDALCEYCAMRSIDKHKKGPDAGIYASTHVYDCHVNRITDDGILYLTGFESRNPPPSSIHWRTTKRLSPPNLVGVVKTRAKGAALQDADLIKWGEVVYHGHSRDEERRRINGDLAINVSTIVDFEPDFFEEGTYVAVVDCMSFVPEWIPVLKALEAQKEISLPFENGKYLNLQMQEPVEPSNFWTEVSPNEMISTSHSEIFEKMIDSSTLEPIREIRRHEHLREELVSRLDSLVTQTTLDKGQLISFIDSLQHPVHLTQGPPGTGKSYLGVVLVRALTIIRELWMKKASGAPPPILVLSYKNHAIDEFLVDLVKAEPLKMRNNMIRIGGQCKDSRLAMFSERNTYQSNPIVKQKRACLEHLHNLRASIQATVEGDLASFLAYRQAYRTETDPKTRRNCIVQATQTMMEMIARRTKLKTALAELKEFSSNEGYATPDEVVKKLNFLEVSSDGNNRSASITIQFYCQQDRSDELLSLLNKEIKHYGNRKHWGDILFLFLCGKVPLPPCCFEAKDGSLCRKPSVAPDTSLCDDHRCIQVVSDDGLTRCAGRCANEHVSLCSAHACGVTGCQWPKLEGYPFCQGHCCRRCVELKVPECRKALELPPRNVCGLHPLCVFPGCCSPCQQGQHYCDAHSVASCKALNKKKQPCKSPPISRLFPYCQAHKHLAYDFDFGSDSENEEDDSSDSEGVIICATPPVQKRQICEAITKRGRPCKGVALPGKPFCYDHDFSDGGNDAKIEVEAINDPHTVDRKEEKILVAKVDSSKIDDAKDMGEDDWATVGSVKSVDSLSSSGSIELIENNTGKEFDEVEADEEEGENLQHLREVFEVAESGDDALLEIEDSGSVDGREDSDSIEEVQYYSHGIPIEPTSWTWTMTEDERWEACQTLLADLRSSMAAATSIVKGCSRVAQKEYQKAVVKAKARMYENKSVIGGTMVGCISRLESIRATRPFAVVVEEASEVLEPLLFSCLTESTIKLEMIGDHRQLQPSVMSRYEFELNNRINTSMFQRLIEAPPGHMIPSTVLSIQRRMRRNICNLTREYYADVVEIQDDEGCSQQLIGSRSAPSNTLTSSTLGREVPGVAPHMFLWTHNGAQKRSNIGISRINPVEATMACSLARYLVSCGVPKTSIAILTPYKGQLMEMRKMLLQGNQKLLSRDPSSSDVCRVSTVDRFQGDEEDIIICSLVVDENSKTNFVKLVNRMIVLLSRARLGLYIIANGTYFQNDSNVPRHWRRTLELLESPGTNDSNIETVDKEDIYSGCQFGPKLPLCCPGHRSITKDVSSASDLNLGFCTEVCQEILSCGHSCRLRCHWPNQTHNNKCDSPVNSPCAKHPRELTCHQIYKEASGAPKNLKHDQILPFVRCSVSVDLELPCGHNIKKRCWEVKKIEEREISVPQCFKPSPVTFQFPGCGHRLEVTCNELELYNANPSLIRCKQAETYQPPCDHELQMECWRYQEYIEGDKTFNCSQQVRVVLPRCGHVHTVPCSTSRGLSSWDGTRCDEIGRVVEGTKYGPEDYVCKETVIFVRKCGHNLNATCHEAISKSCSWKPCREKTKIRNPDCGHSCYISCSDKALLDGKVPSLGSLAGLLPSCAENVQLTRKCGHIETITCAESRKPLHGCMIEVSLRSGLCRHLISVPCRLRDRCSETHFWDDLTITSIESDGKIPAHSEFQVDMNATDSDVAKALQSCQQELSIELQCGHQTRVKCKDIVSQIARRSELSALCEEQVTVQLDCGHATTTSCMIAQSSVHSLRCDMLKPQQCWNFSHCKSKLLAVPCSFNGSAGCMALTNWICPKTKHMFQISVCSTGVPNFCPDCYTEDLKAMIESKQFDREARDCLESIFCNFPADNISFLPPNDDEWTRQNEFLQSYLQKEIATDPWKRSQASIQPILCMRIIKKDNAEPSMLSFDPARFVKRQFFNGLMTKTLTSSNIAKVSSSRSEDVVTLLVGYATVVKIKDHRQSSIPTKRDMKSKFVRKLWERNYDSLLYNDPKGLENLIVWDPFPVTSVIVAKLNSNQLVKLAAELCKQKPLETSEPLAIAFTLPGNFIRAAAIENDGDSSEVDVQSVASYGEEYAKLQESLLGTELEGLRIDLDWAGDIASGGSLKRNVEKDLMKKMEFLNDDVRPFRAMKLIEDLQSKTPDVPILHLLLAAENLNHDHDRSRIEFTAYIEMVRRNPDKSSLNPWALVILARIEKQYEKKLLSAFARHFQFSTGILSARELALTKDSLPAKETTTQSWQERLKKDWDKMKSDTNGEAESTAMDELLNLTGLRKVKEEAIRLWKAALQLKRMDDETRKANSITANYCFLGNPGTGKTTVAKLFAQILCDSGVRQRNVCEETTAQEAKDDGRDGFITKADKAMGGVLFIDEAYDLDPLGDFKGKPIVNEILTLCEDKREEISVILAGYEDDFEKKFFAYNSGLKSRFRCVNFDDFDEEELSTIWSTMRSKRKWLEEEGVTRVIVKRMLRMAGKKGFGNAREVRKRLETATQEALARLGEDFSQSNMILLISDVIGEDPRLSNEKLVRVRDEIDEKIGWERVKFQVAELMKVCGVNYGRELRGQPPLDVFLNRMFLGNPGTGKTTCAKLYGRLLKELGFLSNGDVVFKRASDFKGSVVGESEKTTNQVLESAKGKVLIIDEAYNLNDDLYGKQVLDTLVEKVQGGPSDDMAVILIGYEEEMLEMFRNQNPGLSRRFPKDQAFYFDDYNERELLDILKLNLKRHQVKFSVKFLQKSMQVLNVKKRQAHFGNAGEVENLLKGAMVKASERCGRLEEVMLDHMDILDPGSERASRDGDPLSALDNLYRMEKVRAELEKMTKSWEVCRREGDEDPKLGHFVFTGSPGTGKTTVARTIGNVLFSLGLLPTNKCFETSALDLTAKYVGQTSAKVDNALQEAKGGILFIDEAYNLGKGPFGQEACDSLVAGMTSEKFRDVVIVIAGYPTEIDEMLKANSGLRSRFNHFFDFPDWNPKDCVAFFESLARNKNFELEDGVLEVVGDECAKLMKLDGWANGRDIADLWEKSKSNRDSRIYEQQGADKVIHLSDVKIATDEMLNGRSPKGASTTKSGDGTGLFAYDSAGCSPPCREVRGATDVDKNISSDVDLDPEVGETSHTGSDDGRDPGVPDDVWNELQRVKGEAKRNEAEMSKLQDDLTMLQALDAETHRQLAETIELERKALEHLEQVEAQEEEDLRRQIEAELKLLEEKRKEEEETARRIRLERERIERELQRLEEEKRKREETMRKLQQIRPCPMGFSWYKCGGGWRCGGGSHYVSDEELRRQFAEDT